MDKNELVDVIRSVKHTIQQLEIKSTKDNVDKILGCIMELERTEHALISESNETTTKTYGGKANG